MKNIICIAMLVCASFVAGAQAINWKSFAENQKHIANLSTSWDYAATLGVGYAYRMETRLPAVLNAQFSLPAGNDLADDFKAKLGFQVRVFQAGNFQGTVSLFGIYRQFHSDLANFQNFGSEFTGTIGFYKSRWYVATEFGFDKAIVTRVKNSDQMRQNYPGVRDGWYVPTGGNFMFMLQTGYSFKVFDLYVKVGKIIDQNLRSSATVPLTGQLGINVRF